MKINPYLGFNGQCEAAFKFYEQCGIGKIKFSMTYGESPMAEKTPKDWHGKLMHITLCTGESAIMGADMMTDCFQKPQGFSVTINLSDTAEAERIFKALSDGATIRMPIQETFWAARFGMLTDKFGIPWMMNCEKAQPRS